MAHPIVPQIVALLGAFLGVDYGSPASVATLGDPVLGGDDSRELYRPHSIRADFILARRENLPFQAGFLEELEFFWTIPQPMHLHDLEAAFGPSILVPGVETESEDVWHFPLRGGEVQGLLMVTATDDRRGEDLLVQSFSLRRHAPEPFAAIPPRGTRLVVVADFKSTEEPNPWPLPGYIWEKSGVDDLMARWRPEIDIHVINHIEPDHPTVEATFEPTSLDHLHPDWLLRHLPAASAVITLRESLIEMAPAGVDQKELTVKVSADRIPSDLRVQVAALFGQPNADIEAIVASIDERLSRQAETLMSDPGMVAFQAAWLGLEHLAESLDLENGTRLEVYSADLDHAEERLRQTFLATEPFHPEGPPPVGVVLGDVIRPRAADVARLESLSHSLESLGGLLIFGTTGDLSAQESSTWSHLASPGRGALPMGVLPPVHYRRSFLEPGGSPGSFSYQPGPSAALTGITGSGAWVVAGLVLGRIQALHSPEMIRAGLPAPPTLRKRRKKEIVLGIEVVPSVPNESASSHLSVIGWDAVSSLIVPVRLRPVPDSPDDWWLTRAATTLVDRTIQRLEVRTLHTTEPGEVEASLREALRLRFPGTVVEVHHGHDPVHGDRMAVHVSPGATSPLKEAITVERPWKTRRSHRAG